MVSLHTRSNINKTQRDGSLVTQGTVLCLFAGSRDACPYKLTTSDFTNTGIGYVVKDKKRLHPLV